MTMTLFRRTGRNVLRTAMAAIALGSVTAQERPGAIICETGYVMDEDTINGGMYSSSFL